MSSTFIVNPYISPQILTILAQPIYSDVYKFNESTTFNQKLILPKSIMKRAISSLKTEFDMALFNRQLQAVTFDMPSLLYVTPNQEYK